MIIGPFNPFIGSARQASNPASPATVEAVPGVRNRHQVRLRYSGAAFLFIDLHVLVDGNQTLIEAHNLAHTKQLPRRLCYGAPEPF
jgi:divalent metal cation (Fe/Co/Zn/Cd) transporter